MAWKEKFMHEYSVIGHPKHKITFGIAALSGVISSIISNEIQPWLQELFNFSSIATFPVSTFTIFSLLYLLFSLLLWKSSLYKKLFHVPNLDGDWDCIGLSNNIKLNKQFDWNGIVNIRQDWDKILITLKTENSQSNSLSTTVGIKYYSGMGYKLSYHYENTPRANTDKDLQKHEGFCILTFSEDLQSAEGCYFNNMKERQAYGDMKLIRRPKK